MPVPGEKSYSILSFSSRRDSCLLRATSLEVGKRGADELHDEEEVHLLLAAIDDLREVGLLLALLLLREQLQDVHLHSVLPPLLSRRPPS